METQSNWPYTDQSNEPTIEINKRMIHKLLERNGNDKNLFGCSSLAYVYGHNFECNRRKAGLTYTDIRGFTGLDTGFLCILANGKALLTEIHEVLPILTQHGLLDEWLMAWDSV